MCLPQSICTKKIVSHNYFSTGALCLVLIHRVLKYVSVIHLLKVLTTELSAHNGSKSDRIKVENLMSEIVVTDLGFAGLSANMSTMWCRHEKLSVLQCVREVRLGRVR